MARPARAGLIGMVAATMLSGCILFPPFFPMDPPFGETSVVIENTTDDDWVVSFGGGLGQAFAVAAGETGVATLFEAEPGEAALLDPDDCATIGDGIELGPDDTGVRIDPPAALAALTTPVDEGLPRLAEFWECPFGTIGEPAAGEPLPEATGTIRFVGEDGGAWTLTPADGMLTNVIVGDPSGWATEHTWSPDGSRVAYTVMDDVAFTQAVHVAEADGSGDRLLVEDAAAPSWSPDGTRIAYTDTDPFTGRGALAVIDADGSGAPVHLTDGPAVPRWSPDSARIAFVGADPADPFATEGELSVLDVASGEITVVSEVAAGLGMFAWSPDGTTIAFASGTIGPYDITAVEVDSGAHRTIAQVDGATLSEPAWSPDGTQVAFVIDTSSLFRPTSGLAVTDADGSSAHRVLLESDSDFYYSPTWSPDGRYVAVVRSGMELSSEMVVIEADGGESVVVATGAMAVAGWVR